MKARQQGFHSPHRSTTESLSVGNGKPLKPAAFGSSHITKPLCFGLGSMGQPNYAASNAMLDGIARHRRGLDMPGTAIQWGAWGEAGMAASMDQVNRRRVHWFKVAPWAV